MRIFLLWLITTVACNVDISEMTLIKQSTRFAIPELIDGSVKLTGSIRETIYEGTKQESCSSWDPDKCSKQNGVLVIAHEVQFEISGNWTNKTQIIIDLLDSEKNESILDRNCSFETANQSESDDQKTFTCRVVDQNFVIADNDCIAEKDKESCLSLSEDRKL